MKSLFGGIWGKPLAFLTAISLMLLCGANVLAEATVVTDKLDYPPRSTANISGSGFLPGETVELQVLRVDVDENTGPEHQPWQVTTDANGNFQTSWYVDPHELNGKLKLTASGLISGRIAEASFTDAAKSWLGGTSTDWNTAGNWSPSGVPGTGDDVTIPAGRTFYPNLTSAANSNVKSIVINSGGTLTMSAGGSLATVNGGSVTGAGILTMTGGTLTVGNSSAGSDLGITGTLNLQGGTLKVGHDFNKLPASMVATGGTVEFLGNSSGGAFPIGTYTFYNIQIDAAADPGFNNAANTIRVAGSWTDSGVPVLTGTTIEFNGSGTQTFGGSHPTTFANVQIDSGAQLNLATGFSYPVTALTIAGAAKASGTWGSSSSGSLHQNNTFFASSGTLNVSTGGTATTTTLTRHTGTTTPSTYGDSLSFDVSVNNGATGTVSLFDGGSGGTLIGSGTLSSGSCTITPSSTALDAGNHNNIVAVYNADDTHNTSTSAALSTQVVNPLAAQLSGAKVYDGTTEAAGANLTVSNALGGDSVSLTGSGTLSAKDVGSRTITAPGTPLRVNSATGAVGSAVATSFGVTVTAPQNGNTLIAVISTRRTSANAVSSISQTGATWVRAAQSSGNGGTGSTTEIWYAANVSGATTSVTINLAASLFASAVIIEYEGVLTASSLDVVANSFSNGTAGTAATTGTTAMTTQVNELWVGGIGLVNSTFTLGTPNNSFSSVANSASGSAIAGNNAKVYALEKIVSSTGTASSGGTISSASQWSGAIATFKAGSLGLSGTDAGNYTLTGLSGSMTVTAKALSVSGITAASTIYDGTTTAKLGGTAAFLATEAAGTGTTADGKPYNVDSVSPGTVTGTLSAKDVGTQNVTTSVLVTGTGSGNYTVTSQAGLTQQVTAKALSVSGITAASTIYDGTTTAKLGGAATFESTEAPGSGTTGDGRPYNVDSVSPSGTAAGTLAAKDVGTQAVTITGVTVTGTGSSNYSATQQTGLTQQVTAKALSVSGITAASTIYDGTATAKLGGTAAFQSTEAAGAGTTADGKPYNVDSVSPGGTAAGTLAAKDVGTQAVTITGVTVTGTGSGNYTATQQTGLTQQVTAKALSVSGITAASTIYDGTATAKLGGTAAFQPTEAPGPGTTGDGRPYNVDSVAPGTVTGTLAAKDVGTQNVTTSVTVTGTGSGNYTVTSQAGLTQQVTAKALSVSGITAASTIYDGTTTAKLGGAATFQSTEAPGPGTTGDGRPYDVDSVLPGGTAAGTLAARDVGTQAVTITGVTVTGTGSGNYTATQQTGLTQQVTAKELSVSGITAASTIYDGTTTAKLSGTAAFQPTEAPGPGTSGDGKPYNVDSVAPGTVTGTLAAKDVGTQNVTTSVTVTGPGSGNYTVTSQAGLTQQVTAKALSVSGITAPSTIYDGTTTAKLGGAAAFQSTEAPGSGTTGDGKPYSVDSVSPGIVSGTLAARDVGTQNVTTSVTVTGAGSGNYTTTPQTGLSQQVTAKALTAQGTLSGVNKIYDGGTTASVTGSAALQSPETAGSGTTADGIPYSVDSVSLTGTAAYNFSDPSVGTGKTVTESGLSLTGSGFANYTLTPPTVTADITSRAIVISGTRFYDATATATASILTVDNNIDGGDLTLSGSVTLASMNPGSRAITDFTSLTLSGSAAGNYTKTGASGSVLVSDTKTDSGTTTITASNSSDVDLYVENGTLVVNNSPGTSINGNGTVHVNTAGKIAGSGQVGGLEINSGGAVSPGNSPGTTTAGNTTWAPAGNYDWEINDATGTAGADPGWDLLAITGNLDITATSGSRFTISVISLTLANAAGNAVHFDPSTTHTWHIASVSGTITGFDPAKFTIDTTGFSNFKGGGTFSIQQNTSFIDLVFTPHACASGEVSATWDSAGGTINITLEDIYGLSRLRGLRFVNITATYTAYDVADAVIGPPNQPLPEYVSPGSALEVTLPSGTVKVITIGTRLTSARASMNAQGYDLCGFNSQTIDPVHTRLEIGASGETTQTFTEIPSAEHYVSVHNGTPGLTKLTVLVNGKPFVLAALTDGESRTLDIATAMNPGEENTVVLVGEGPEGASADVAIGDSPTGDPVEAATTAVGTPVLQFERLSEGLQLSWPEEGTGLELQSQAGLGSGNPWVRRTEAPTVSNGKYRVTLPYAGDAQLFRLHKP